MRSTMLASTAAILFTAGIACAQTMSPAPAPTGAPNGPVETAPGLSPGNTTPPNSAAGASTSMAAPSTQAASSQAATNTMSPAPAPTGATNGPVETAPGLSPGKSTAPNAVGGTQAASNMADPAAQPPMKKHHHHKYMGMMASDTGAAGYLRTAKMDIGKHDKSGAEDALSHAETRLLTRSVPQSETTPVDDSPAITSIENARKALSSGDMTEASTDTDLAMSQMHHGHMDHNKTAGTPDSTYPADSAGMGTSSPHLGGPANRYPAGTSVLSNPTSNPPAKN